MGRAAAGAQLEPENSARGETQAIVGGLAVDQEPWTLAARRFIGDPRTVAATLLADHEHERDPRFAMPPQLFGCRYLRREDPFRVARAAAKQPVAFDAAGKKRGDTVEVGGERHGRRSACPARHRCDHVEARIVDALLLHRPAAIAKVVGEPSSRGALAAGGRVDVDEAARQRDDVYRIHASSSVRVSVRESRYFTITGVASERRHSTPLPDVTARAPGTTTAPSGTTSGRSAVGRMISPLTRS